MRFYKIAIFLAALAVTPLPAAEPSAMLEPYKGKVVYLDFWASWCEPCKKSFPWMQQMQTRYGDQGLQVVAVSVDEDAADMQAFLETQTISFEILHDPQGSLAQSYGIIGMPSSFLLDREGRVVERHMGFNLDSALIYESGIKDQLSASPN